jgi:hypothetical protein
MSASTFWVKSGFGKDFGVRFVDSANRAHVLHHARRPDLRKAIVYERLESAATAEHRAHVHEGQPRVKRLRLGATPLLDQRVEIYERTAALHRERVAGASV